VLNLRNFAGCFSEISMLAGVAKDIRFGRRGEPDDFKPWAAIIPAANLHSGSSYGGHSASRPLS
jgi:hypothetical protein